MAVRRESVVLTLEDQFTTGMAKAAAATAVLNKNLHDLDGTSVDASDGVQRLGDDADRTGSSLRRTGTDIDKFSGRLRVLADLGLTLGPALVPLGGAGVAAVAGLAAQFGALAGGVGIAIASLNGVGDALEAVNDYQLDPSRENLAKVAEEFERIGPAAAEFVVYLESITPQLRELQMTAREEFLPGLQAGIEGLLTRGPQVNRIVQDMAAALGDLSRSAGEALGGDRFAGFFDYIERTGGQTLLELGRSIGYVTEALSNMLVAFSPLSSDFSAGMEGMARSFAEWSATLDTNESFQEFLTYLRTNGPAAVDFLGSLVQALASLVEAAAPVGQAILPALTALLDVFAAIAGTPIGTTVLAAAAAFVAFNRATSVLSPALGRIGDSLFLTDRAFQQVDGSATKASGSLTKAAASAGVWFLAFEGISEIISGVDSLNRSLDVSSASMANLADIQAAVSSSNLGKYAATLGIDMQRLSADLAENGRQGEYVQQVLGELGEESGGTFANLVDAAGIGQEVLGKFGVQLGKQSNEASMAGVALEGLLDRYEETGEAAKGAADAQEQLAQDAEYASTNLGRLQDRLKAAREELKANRQDARSAAQTFVGLGDSLNDSEKSLGDWLAELERNARALQEFQRNAREAGRRGLDEGLVKSLQAAGSEGALRMRELANATDSQIERANEAWRRGQGAVKDFVDEVGGVKPKYVTKLEARVDEALADLARLRAQLNIPDEYVNVYVTTRRAGGSPGFGPQVGSADGGTVPKTGKPYADRHPYLLADGEEVISNRFGQADRHRSLLKAINAGRLADGGTAGIGRTPAAAIGLGYQIAQANSLAEAMDRSRRSLEAELRVRARLLARELDASKQRLDALKQERDSIVSMVTARLTTTELFGQVQNSEYRNLTRPENFDQLTPEQQRNFLAAEWEFNQSLGFGQVTSPADLLRADIEKAKRERELIKQLRARGLNGAALQAAITQDGGLEGAASLSQAELVQFEQLYNRRDRVVANTAGGAGDAVFGRAIDRQTAVVRELRSEARDTNRRLERLEELAKKNPRETGREVGSAVNDAAAAGQRRRS